MIPKQDFGTSRDDNDDDVDYDDEEGVFLSL
jgi:hypothetical protein